MSIFPMSVFLAPSRILAGVLLGLAATVSQAADVDWEGWRFGYDANDNSSGLVLTDVEYRGTKILERVGMPVIRVQYENDICGPYADILSRFVQRPATEGAPDSACDDQALCTRTFTRDGERMLEVGSNWQIGEYQIYQTYYFSENGYFDARVFSRGLQCRVDHSHHAHWMFDFDIDGAADDRVRRADGSVPATEFNDLRADSAFWDVEDDRSGHSVRVMPAADDGAPSAFSRWDVAVRAYESTEVGRWRLGARGEIGDHHLDGESVDGSDVVLWYVSHLPHSANEGSRLWHSAGPRVVPSIDTAPPPAAPEPPPPTASNLLSNGGFESALAGWLDCGPDTGTEVASDVVESGAAALRVVAGGCLYQEVPISAGESHTLSCQARREGLDWTIMELSYLDADYEALLTEIVQIGEGTDFAEHVLSGSAPSGAERALVLLYSEDDTRFDRCVLEPGIRVPPAANADTQLLRNGGFEAGLSNWNPCAAADLVDTSTQSLVGAAAAALENGGCLYQEFPVTVGQTYTMDCGARRSGERYSSVTFAIMDAAYASLEREELAVASDTYTRYESRLTAPADSRYGSVIAYSENPARFDDCTVRVD